MQAGFQTFDFSQDLSSDLVWQRIQFPLGDRAVFDSIAAAIHYQVDYAIASNEASTIRLLIVSALARLQNGPDFINTQRRWQS